MSRTNHSTDLSANTTDVPREPTTMRASAVVRSFLAAMEVRDLDGARGHLSKSFRMTFPGNAHFCELEELVAWSKARYRSIAKSYTRFDEATDGQMEIVYCFGTLSGVLPDGTGFEGVRFIDRFTVQDGKLHDQQVWNDMGEILGSR